MSTQDFYTANATRLAGVYEGLPAEQAHGAWLRLFKELDAERWATRDRCPERDAR